MESGWSQKAIHRLIVTSATYRQSSRWRPDLEERDPGNNLLARQSRFRVEAEIIRDAALAASGLLNPALGGPSVYPPIPSGGMQGTQVQKAWPTAFGPDRYRRGLYTFRFRSPLHPGLGLFDAPDGASACTRRVRSDSPLQALTLLNDTAFVEAARALAERILHEGRRRGPLADRIWIHRRAGEKAERGRGGPPPPIPGLAARRIPNRYPIGRADGWRRRGSAGDPRGGRGCRRPGRGNAIGGRPRGRGAVRGQRQNRSSCGQSRRSETGRRNRGDGSKSGWRVGRVDGFVARALQPGRLHQSQLGSIMTPEQRLLNETRRHFFSRCARRRGPDRTDAASERRTPSGRTRGIRQSDGPEAASLSGESEKRHLPVHGRRAQPARDVRLQAQAPGIRWQADSRFAGGRQAVRLHGRVRQGAAEGSGNQDANSSGTAGAARGCRTCCRTSRRSWTTSPSFPESPRTISITVRRSAS